MENAENRHESQILASELFQWVKAIFIAVILALLIRGFVFEPVQVLGPSMEDTLFTGQRLVVYKLGYYFHAPAKGDIIVLQYEEGLASKIPLIRDLPFIKKAFPAVNEVDYIKRVIAVPGDTVDLADGSLLINGKKYDESYTKGLTYKQILDFPITVPPGKVFVLGDNRQNSTDSRTIGLIEYNRIKGKAILRIWPLNSFGSLY